MAEDENENQVDAPFTAEEKALIAALPAKPPSRPGAPPLSQSFVDRMTSSLADPDEAKKGKQPEAPDATAIVFRA